MYREEDIQLFRREMEKKKTLFQLVKWSLFEMFTCRHAVVYTIFETELWWWCACPRQWVPPGDCYHDKMGWGA